MKNTIVIGFILGCMSMIACQQEIPTEGINPTGIYTLDGNLGGDDMDSRAQIKLGKKESGGEEFFWNKEDSFALYQYKDEQLSPTIFTITEFYDESDSAKSTNASFKSETPVNGGRYVAVYPAHTPLVDGNALQFSFSHDLDFTDAITPEAKNEVWKQYIKDHMFMIAEGNLNENQYNTINFRHMCSLARITLTNETGKDMNIKHIQLGNPNGKLFYEISRQFVILPHYNYLGGGGCTNLYRVNTKNLIISSGETMDFYIFFLPKEFEEDALLSISLGGYYPTLFLGAREISGKNQGVTSFEAGKRYWFKVSNTLEGMVWSKDFEEIGLEGELITIDDPIFSNALHDLFGDKYITINDEGKAVMYQSFADWIKELNLNDISGIKTLAGIENFKNLEKLSARHAKLKAVDVSQNLALKYLDLTDNPDIKQLDLSKNILLDDLQITNMPISSIDLSYNVNLETGLLLVDMPITQLDLSKNVKLKGLNCRSCKISELDITPLTHLEGLCCGGQQDNITIQVYMTEKQKELWDTEWCHRWENENVVPIVKNEETIIVNNTALSNALLNTFGNKYITINDEGNAVIYKWFADTVIELVLDGIDGLETLSGIENFTNLKKLSIRNTNLKALDVSRNLALEDLRLNNLSISQLDLSKNVKLKYLDCSNCKLTELDITTIYDLGELYCGNQQENSLIHVCMREGQINIWHNRWINYDDNVNVMAHVEDDKLITFSNPSFSKILYDMLGSKIMVINNLGNAIMYQSSADRIKQLNLDGKEGLETLSGIEYFTNLERLSARQAKLKAVDVSKNLALKYLDLTDNPDIKQLDLSKNILLQDLQLTQMPISSIDLSPNVNLEAGLLLVNMPITQLDLSKNVKLKQLNCRHCKISELDITPLANLEKLYCGRQQDNIVIHVYMTEKQKELWDADWGNLFEHANNVIPIVKEIESVTIENPVISKVLHDTYGDKYITINNEGNAVMSESFANSITELNLNDMDNLKSLSGIEKLTNLERLSISKSPLNDMDLSKNLRLEYLLLSDNPNIKQLDLSQNIALDDLLLLNMPITSIDLCKNVNLETGLLLVDLPLTKLDVSKNVKLKSFNCRSCKISELDITPLTKLEKLYCGGQQDNITIQVYMTEKQKKIWDAEWCHRWENANVMPIVK